MRPEAAKQDIELKAQKQTLGKKRPEECKGKTNYTHLERWDQKQCKDTNTWMEIED